MVAEIFVPKKFHDKTLIIVNQAREILSSYAAEGFTMTLRQVYYQFVKNNWIANKQSEYKRLGSILNEARLAGYIDWDWMEDRDRNLQTYSSWQDQQHLMTDAANWYREDLWDNQRYRPEVWVEKTALIGVVERACNRRRVPHFATVGNNSQSEQYLAGKRFAGHIENGQIPIVFHLGDHDPNGIDMTRDNHDRFEMFAGEEVTVRRLALNMDQIREHNPPPNPVKFTDTRSAGYVRKFGRQSWELDALNPKIIEELVRDALDDIIDEDLWSEALEHERQERRKLAATAENWNKVQEFIGKQKWAK